MFAREPSGSCLAASTLTRAIIRLTPDAKSDLERGDRGRLKELTPDQFQECVDMGLLVPDEMDERAHLGYFLHKDRLAPQALTTFVAFSTACNLACVYCYEAGQVKPESMSEHEIASLVGWYRRQLENGAFEVCSVDLYGGEPLLRLPLIMKLLGQLSQVTSALGVRLAVRLVTNGYLLSPKTITSLAPFGLEEVHVTLDGPADTHNRLRPLKKGIGSFDRIFANLIAITSVDLPFDIICRITVDSSNVARIPALLDLIRQEDHLRRIEPYFGFITQTTAQVGNPESFCSRHMLRDEEVVEHLTFLYTEAQRRGFAIPDFFTLGPCFIAADGGVVIAPSGKIYKCLDMIGCEDMVVGDIASPDYDPLYYTLMQAPQLDECLSTDCPFVPVCGGGCMMESYLKFRDPGRVSCHRPMLQQIYEALLPLQFAQPAERLRV